MALLDVLIGIVIGFVGGVVVPAAMLYRYRRRIGQWFIERQATQAIEEGFGFDEAAGDAGLGTAGFGEPGVNEPGFDGSGVRGGGLVGQGMNEARLDEPGAAGSAPGTTGTGGDASTPEATVVGSEDETGRCDCGELVSPRLDEVCPNCGAPVVVE
jgi:hypothetical protein